MNCPDHSNDRLVTSGSGRTGRLPKFAVRAPRSVCDRRANFRARPASDVRCSVPRASVHKLKRPVARDHRRRVVGLCGPSTRLPWTPAMCRVAAINSVAQQRAVSCIRQLIVSVEPRCGALAPGSVCLLPLLSSGGARVTVALTPFPHPAQRTGHAGLPHPQSNGQTVRKYHDRPACLRATSAHYSIIM